MVTTVLSGFGVLFFSVVFIIGVVESWQRPWSFSAGFGQNLFFCLLCAVICAYLGGW